MKEHYFHRFLKIGLNSFLELILSEIRRRISQPEVLVFGAKTVPPTERYE